MVGVEHLKVVIKMSDVGGARWTTCKTSLMEKRAKFHGASSWLGLEKTFERMNKYKMIIYIYIGELGGGNV